MSEKVPPHANGDHGSSERRLTTVTLSPEQFEMLYLQPKNAATGTYSRSFGNPTPIGMTCFLLAFTPLAFDLLEFQGATAFSTTTLIGVFYGVAGIGLWISCILEWAMGNTFPSVVFGAFGGFWISYGILIQPTMEIAAAFAGFNPTANVTSEASAAVAGAATRQFNSGIALYLVTWQLLSFTFFLASLRTNVLFVIMFFCLNGIVGSLSAAYFHTGAGQLARAAHEFRAGGAFALAATIAGWWVNIHLILASTGWPVNLPLFDLSGKILTGGGRADMESGTNVA